MITKNLNNSDARNEYEMNKRVNNWKKIVNSIVILILFSCISGILVSGSITWVHWPSGMQTVDQDSGYYYDCNGTVDAPFNPVYTDDSESQGFSVFFMSNSTGIINFTPRNADVGYYSIYLILSDSNESNPDAEVKQVKFNITNVNDPPNITGYVPSSLTIIIEENETLGFGLSPNATDIDLILANEDALSIVWYINGTNISNQSNWSYTPGFCEAGLKNITLYVEDSYSENDSLSWSVNVTNLNRVPVFNSTIQNFTWDEDNNYLDAFNLDVFSYDLDLLECGTNISYSVTGNISISVVINSTTHNVSFYITEDWFGNETIYFIINDSINYSVSNAVYLEVNGTNDAPVIENLTNKTAAEDVPFSLYIFAYDKDNDILNYTDNSTWFNITDYNRTHGLISFTPSVLIAGQNQTIQINVTDGELNDSIWFVLSVFSNLPPQLQAVDDQSMLEGSAFLMYIFGNDSNAEDNLSFSANTTMFSITTLNNSYENATGYISFTPADRDVGNWTIRICVNDTKYALDCQDVQFNISDYNNPPVLDAILSPQDANINKSFGLIVTASDLDGDTLIFYSNSSLFNVTTISATAGQISSYPNITHNGTHAVNISVTDGSKWDFQVVIIDVIENRPPFFLIPQMGDIINATEDIWFTYTINATDNDSQDVVLTITDDSPLFDVISYSPIHNASAYINLTANYSQVGIYNITLTVDDGHAINQTWFWLNITPNNDAPYFFPNLTNQTTGEYSWFSWWISVYDEEGDSFSIHTNSSLFNVTTVNSTHGYMNVFPTGDYLGTHLINFSVNDSLNGSFQLAEITVYNVNNTPNITWWSPGSLLVNMSEGQTQLFNQITIDYDGQDLNYSWYLDGVIASLDANYSYFANYSQNGSRNLTILVSDISMLNDSLSWTININNTNRVPNFGSYNDSASYFVNGVENQTNGTYGGITLNLQNSTHYFSSGIYRSRTITLPPPDYQFNYSTISWSGSIPSGSTVKFQTRTSGNAIIWGDWSSNYTNGNASTMTSDDSLKYIQYRVYLETTNLSSTPNISTVMISYQIADLSWEAGIYSNWADLDNYFSDQDNDDPVNYSVIGNTNIYVTIDSNTNIVSLSSAAGYQGSETIRFSRSDGFNSTNSNDITLTVVPSSGQGGGGGTGGSSGSSVVYQTRTTTVTMTKTRTVPKNVTVPSYMKLIHLQDILTLENDTMIVPMLLKNNLTDSFYNISLSAESENEYVNFSFSIDNFDEIAPESDVETILNIVSFRDSNSYEIKIKAHVESPNFNDSETLFIGSLELGDKNETQLNTKITFTMDFLRENGVCLELTELVDKANDALKAKDYDSVVQLLDAANEGCKYLLSSQVLNPERPELISETIFDKIKRNYILQYLILVVASIIAVIIIGLIVLRVKKKKKKKR